jgi:nucleotide-binding universal stress UspA family protein
MSSWQKICCPVDFSETSHLAMEEATKLMRRSGGELTLLHVTDSPAGSAEEMVVAPPELFQQTTKELERKLESWRVEAERATSTSVRAKILSGLPATEIVSFAREGSFDLLVMGTHGRRGFRHMLIGSVVEKVIREAHCPVLVVRPLKH